ncbi:mutS protein homolog 4-like, partial [Stegodyphus dumicola]|uniref:mutS protein homolog 4-like n=1 Tax=Stegodyphus dumicola TaxID=202533 RepID=UPI0015ABBD16
KTYKAPDDDTEIEGKHIDDISERNDDIYIHYDIVKGTYANGKFTEGTNAEEGRALAYSICEELLMTKAFIFCSTHFMELTRLPLVYPNAENYHFNVEFTDKEDGNCTCNFTYKLVPGPCKAQYYGLKLAEFSTMPKSIIHEAKQLTAAWAKAENNSNQEQQHFGISGENKEKIKLAIHLLQLSDSSLNEEDLRSHLKELKRMFISPSSSADSPSIDFTQFS